jgi:hypothetical protein
MSNDTLQNLNEKDFKPDYGTDKHGIQYSCGHINPLQKALKLNTLPKLEAIKSNLENLKNSIDVMIGDANYIANEVMEFAKTRCEDVRSINRELRDTIENGCGCSSNDNCDNCSDLEYKNNRLTEERDEAESDKFFYEEKSERLENKVEELETMLKDIVEGKETLEKNSKEINEKYSYLKWIFDKIAKKE